MNADSPLVGLVHPTSSLEVWSRDGAAVRAIAIHEAEGGGTVGWLDNPDGNSSHYVVEYSGRLVQMVPESMAAGSINPKLVRTTDDAPYTYLGDTIRYGISALKAALGGGYTNPNRYVIAIETEGFAATGPNTAQRATLKALVADIRRRRGHVAVIGHRDAQAYKACPGHHIPWADYGGHYPAAITTPPPPEDPMGLNVRLLATTDTTPLDAFGTAKVKGTGHSIIRVADRAYVSVADGESLGEVQVGALTKPLDTRAGDRTNVVAFNHDGELYVALRMDVDFTPAKDATPFSQADVDAKVALVTTSLTSRLETANGRILAAITDLGGTTA